MQNYYIDFSEDFYFPNKIKRENKKAKILKRLYGKDEHGIINLPKKLGSAMASKHYVLDNLVCSFCAPNKGCNKFSRRGKRIRNWKHYRKAQLK